MVELLLRDQGGEVLKLWKRLVFGSRAVIFTECEMDLLLFAGSPWYCLCLVVSRFLGSGSEMSVMSGWLRDIGVSRLGVVSLEGTLGCPF